MENEDRLVKAKKMNDMHIMANRTLDCRQIKNVSSNQEGRKRIILSSRSLDNNRFGVPEKRQDKQNSYILPSRILDHKMIRNGETMPKSNAKRKNKTGCEIKKCVENNEYVDESQYSDKQEPEKGRKRGKTSANAIASILLHLYDFGVRGGQLYFFEEKYGYWKIIQGSNETRELRALIPAEQRDDVNKLILLEVYEWLCIEAEILDEDKKIEKYFLNFRDCAVDWRTGECVYERKEMHFFYFLDVDYRNIDDRQNGSFKTFLDDIFKNDKETKREFEKFLGLCLSDIRNLKICAFLYGPSNTGKSVMLNLLKLLVGKEWTASVSFSQLSSEFAVSRLLGKRLNVSGEVSGTTNKRLDIFKSLTGNDEIEICFKGKDYFAFQNTCLLTFACNSFPPIQYVPEFQSFLSRLIIFPFQNEKPRLEWINNLEYKLLGDSKRIVEVAMRGLRHLEEDGFQINETKAMRECKKEFLGLYDSFSLFAEKYLEVDGQSRITSNAIKHRYEEFCRDNNYSILDVNIWGQVLRQKYHCRQCTMVVNDEFGCGNASSQRRVRAYQGIRIRDNDEITQDDSDWTIKRRG